jgi:hypothetical protein
VRNGVIRRIDKAISLIKQFALSEGIKLTAQSLTKFVNPQLSLFAKRPSQFTGKEDLQGWTNFMVGRLTYLRGKILDTKICRPPPAPPPPPTEVKPQCEQPLPATAQGLKTELDTLFVKVKKTQIFVESTSQFDLEKAINQLEEENRQRAWLIKKVEENPGGEHTPENVHPATFLEELKEAQKQTTEDIEILKRMLELRRKLDDLSYAPCPATGLYAGLEGWGRLHTTERNADTDEIPNEFTDNGDPLGGGIVLGYNFRPWHDSIVVGPFGSFDWLDQTVNHTFPGGSFLGTRSNWIATVGGKAGVATTSGVFFYGLAGRPG